MMALRNRGNKVSSFANGVVAGLTATGVFVGSALTPPSSGKFQSRRDKGGISSDMVKIGRDMYTSFRQVAKNGKAS